jgi:hypothetical protein
MALKRVLPLVVSAAELPIVLLTKLSNLVSYSATSLDKDDKSVAN